MSERLEKCRRLLDGLRAASAKTRWLRRRLRRFRADEIERLTAENQRLRDALQPFAERHIGVHEYFNAKAENPPRYIMVELVWLRAAYHALEEEARDE